MTVNGNVALFFIHRQKSRRKRHVKHGCWEEGRGPNGTEKVSKRYPDQLDRDAPSSIPGMLYTQRPSHLSVVTAINGSATLPGEGEVNKTDLKFRNRMRSRMASSRSLEALEIEPIFSPSQSHPWSASDMDFYQSHLDPRSVGSYNIEEDHRRRSIDQWVDVFQWFNNLTKADYRLKTHQSTIKKGRMSLPNELNRLEI
ncbi:hypothetical protein CROQUDRAFT_94896 [Cronartium quercuum f. sp. fusiforme G11]|uniref:Uncharacterized protein n=1 Tax=Cronartium quercuum f. sp. fusiforme G11 TaxID=708437 RepID=A0A9P6NF97_9BASI|nr:hypothetical protein CROQUDRAFT_94896 [Cronartium quercuum f. sp. fusiforme G11]